MICISCLYDVLCFQLCVLGVDKVWSVCGVLHMSDGCDGADWTSLLYVQTPMVVVCSQQTLNQSK